MAPRTDHLRPLLLVALTQLCTAVALLVAAPARSSDLVVYDDALQNGFQDYSWAVHDLANGDPVAVGSLSISMEPDGWTGVYFFSPAPIAVADYPDVRFWIHGGSSGGQQLRLYLQQGETFLGELLLEPPTAGVWEQRTVYLSDLGLTSGLYDGVIFQDQSGDDQGTVYFDQVELLENGEPPPSPTPIAITVDPDVDRRPISPLIYGVNLGAGSQLADLPFPLRRWGGNGTTRYNWRHDISNRADDYFYLNIPNQVADPSQLPHNSEVDVFVDETLTVGSEPILTVPTIGWTPLDERVKKWGFSVSKYGPQLSDECAFYASPPSGCEADAGNGECDPGVNSTGFCSAEGLIVGNDPADTSQTQDPTAVTDWMAHLAQRFGTAAEGGPRFWALDNEPMLWYRTHRDVHPAPATYDEVWSSTVEYATAIKIQDPEAKVLGPVVFGWWAYFTSAADAASPDGTGLDGPDRQAHGGLAFLPWYLEQVCQHEAATGRRLVDYLDVHFYPQGVGVHGLQDNTGEDPVAAARRLLSLRELWDRNHVSDSWIGAPIYLIPRLRDWIDSRCPGVGLALTEYNWGPDDGPTGALAQAEALAILGREGVDLATRWLAPEPGSRSEDAFRIYLDYDGAGARVGGDSVRASSADGDAVGVYAIRGASDELYVLLFNKDTSPRLAQVTVAGELAATAEVYRFDGANPLARVGSLTPDRDGFEIELPPRSAALVTAQLTVAVDCTTSATTLCLEQSRFQTRITWRDPKGRTGSGTAVPLTGNTGYFWFFGSENVEAVIKILDGCAVNDRFWVFAGGLTNVEATLEVVDTLTGSSRIYTNPLGTAFEPIQDTDAFATCATLSTAGEGQAKGAAGGTPSTELLLADGRFRILAEWEDPTGAQGLGQAVALTEDTGYFWFFGPENVEAVIKVLDGCSINGSHWVFAAGLTNVDVTLTVTENQSSATKVYQNPQSTPFAPIQDLEAFSTCP